MKNNFFTIDFEDERSVIKRVLPNTKFRRAERQLIVANSKKFIETIRDDTSFSIEEFLHRYSLSEDEGVAILGLAEGLLRIPDFSLGLELANDKLSDKKWATFLFKRTKSFKTILVQEFESFYR